jgi:superfamily II DNA or RNA helicase
MIRGFRNWQRDAFERFFGQTFCYLISPPGQGKSVMAQAWAMHWAERGKRVLIAAPRTLILDSFKGDLSLQWDDSGKVGQGSEHTFSYNAPDSPLDTWLVDGFDSVYPYHITTHQSVLSALKKLLSKYGPDSVSYDDLAVVIDEAHLMKDSDNNKLGEVLRELEKKGVPVLLATGTPYRGDNEPILSSDFVGTLGSKLTVYTREFYLALDESDDLQGFATKVIVGNTLQVLRHVLSTLIAEDRYAVIKLPTVNTHHARRLGRELGIEANEDKELLSRLKCRFNSEIESLCRDLGLSHLSVVMDNSRDEELEILLSRARAEKIDKKQPDDVVRASIAQARARVATYLPRVVVAQEKVSLGVDCPWWTDSIMLGASRSSTQTVQFGMRSCRDHFSKNDKDVNFWTLVPDYWEPEVTSDQSLQFAKDLVSVQLWWHFLGGGPLAPYLKTSQLLPKSGVASDPTLQIPASPDAAVTEVLNNAFLAGKKASDIVIAPQVHVTVHRPDGTQVKVPVGSLGSGNKIFPIKAPDLPPGVVSVNGSFLSQVIHLAEVLVARGKGKEYHTMLKASQVTPQLIADLFRGGKSVGEISSETGWANWKIEAILKDEGLVDSKKPAPRARGTKEDFY